MLPEGRKRKIYEIAAVEYCTYLLMIGGSEQGDPLPCPRAFCVPAKEIVRLDFGAINRKYAKSNAGNTIDENSRAGHEFYLPALLCTILVQGGKEGDAYAL